MPMSHTENHQLDKGKEKMSFRQPRRSEVPANDPKDQAPRSLINQNLRNRMSQISSMLNEMHDESIFDEAQEESKGAKVEVSEQDYETIIHQKALLQKYVTVTTAEIEKKHHQEYWETIKRVHAKLDVKI